MALLRLPPAAATAPLLAGDILLPRARRYQRALRRCLGTAIPAIAVSLVSARCAATSLVAGWVRLIHQHRWPGSAGDMLSCQLLGLHRWFGFLHCRG